MVYLAVIALAGGIACGMAGLDQNFPVKLITANKDLILYILMFLVGISIGMNKGIVSKIREYHIRIFVIPIGIIAGSLAGEDNQREMWLRLSVRSAEEQAHTAHVSGHKSAGR